MLKMAHDIALFHHERWDGKGYPRGLAGKNIPECARIVAIVDAYDTLTHKGVNRPALSENDALTVMRQESGKMFDPLLLAASFALRRDSRHRGTIPGQKPRERIPRRARQSGHHESRQPHHNAHSADRFDGMNERIRKASKRGREIGGRHSEFANVFPGVNGCRILKQRRRVEFL